MFKLLSEGFENLLTYPFALYSSRGDKDQDKTGIPYVASYLGGNGISSTHETLVNAYVVARGLKGLTDGTDGSRVIMRVGYEYIGHGARSFL